MLHRLPRDWPWSLPFIFRKMLITFFETLIKKSLQENLIILLTKFFEGFKPSIIYWWLKALNKLQNTLLRALGRQKVTQFLKSLTDALLRVLSLQEVAQFFKNLTNALLKAMGRQECMTDTRYWVSKAANNCMNSKIQTVFFPFSPLYINPTSIHFYTFILTLIFSNFSLKFHILLSLNFFFIFFKFFSSKE
jgi:hypothetical protein